MDSKSTKNPPRAGRYNKQNITQDHVASRQTSTQGAINPHLAMKMAYRVANRLIASSGFQPADADDLAQELIADAWLRFRNYDSNRAHVGTFLRLVMAHKASELARKHLAHRDIATRTYSLHEPSASTLDASIPLSETIPEDASIANSSINPIEAAQFMLDILTASSNMTKMERICFHHLAEGYSVTEIQRIMSTTKSTTYTTIKNIRKRLVKIL